MAQRQTPNKAGLVFAVTSLCPVPLLAGGALFGGGWVWAALVYVTLFAFALDEMVAAAGPQDGVEFPAHDALSVALALAHFAVLALAVRALAGDVLPPAQKLGLFLGAGLFMGQIGNANAHELIHRGRRGLHRLGGWVYVSVLFGHHVSAHPLVHHVHVGTRRDPNTARAGEGYYRFLGRAWLGSFRAGLAAETARRALANSRGTGGGSGTRRLHPYAVYGAGAAGCLAVSALLGGGAGVLAHIALAGFAQSQLLLSDYVQHYGLSRKVGPDGRPEPVGPAHSWNAPHWMTGHMMLNAPRHSDHHAHPSRPYPALALAAPGAVPTLPRSLPAMACLALVPPLWRRVMDPRAAQWQPQALRTAAE